MDESLSASRSLVAIRGLRLRVWPMLLALVVMEACLVPGNRLARWLFRDVVPGAARHVGLFVFTATMLQGLTALAAIAAARRLVPSFESHVRWPRGRSLVGVAVAVGVGMGLVMLVADYAPELLARTAPGGGYSLEPPIAAGWLLAMITTGLGEETLFRGLLVGLLVVLIPGRVRVGAFETSVAGVLVAVLFGAAHYETFLHAPLPRAIAQQLYAFAWGLAYVWLMERSKSLVAPIVAHGVGNFVEVCIVMLLMRTWGAPPT